MFHFGLICLSLGYFVSWKEMFLDNRWKQVQTAILILDDEQLLLEQMEPNFLDTLELPASLEKIKT